MIWGYHYFWTHPYVVHFYFCKSLLLLTQHTFIFPSQATVPRCSRFHLEGFGGSGRRQKVSTLLPHPWRCLVQPEGLQGIGKGLEQQFFLRKRWGGWLKPRWWQWFQIFFLCSPRTLGKTLKFGYFFSIGSKPPTRKGFMSNEKWSKEDEFERLYEQWNETLLGWVIQGIFTTQVYIGIIHHKEPY